MPETVQLDREAGLIRIRSFDDISIESMKNSLAESLSIARREDVKKVLVDASDCRSMPGVLDLFHFASDLPIDLRIAVVLSERVEDKLMFAENVAQNRARRLKAFRRQEDAERWLFQEG